MKLGLIVEGQGEVQAAPVLIRRLLAAHGAADVELLLPPFRLTKSKMQHADELARAVELLARKTAPDGAVLVLVDADKDCPAQLGPRLLATARRQRPDRPIAVVVANTEFETWFLAAATSLRGQRGLPADLESPTDPEALRDAKGWLDERMPTGYSATRDQAAFAAAFDLDHASRLDSFDKLNREVRRLCGRDLAP